MIMCMLRVFFFKQKTAYEVRISNWSSDVCSSDLESAPVGQLLFAVVALAEHLGDLPALRIIDLQRGDDAVARRLAHHPGLGDVAVAQVQVEARVEQDRKSTRLNSSH